MQTYITVSFKLHKLLGASPTAFFVASFTVLYSSFVDDIIEMLDKIRYYNIKYD